MTLVEPLTLLTSSNATWTTTQEKSIARDYPFTDIHLETPDQFVLRTYLQFLWLPESIMPINLLVPSLQRVQGASLRPLDSPHPLHAFLDPLLLSVRSVVAKYRTELPQFLAQGGGEGDAEESVMWYALGYEMNEVGDGNSEDAVMLEEKSRNMWLERLERRELQIQILLYLLKLSLPGPCTALPPVKIPVNDIVPSTKKKRPKEREKVIIPAPEERLESFMDKLSTWQLVIDVNDPAKRTDKDQRDWMQTFCENTVERQFKSTLPDKCALLRRKLFPHSPFEDEDENAGTHSSPESQSTRPRSHRKLARSSTSTSISQSKAKPPKPIKRSSSVSSHATTSDPPARSRSLSVSLAQDASARRANSTSATASSLKRALSREVSMSRGFKPRAPPSQASQSDCLGTRMLAQTKKEVRKPDNRSPQGVTLVAATPTKPKVARGYHQASNQSERLRALSLDLEAHAEDDGDRDDVDSDDLPEVKGEGGSEEMWLPSSSPDILLLGPRKRAASGSSSSMGLSDPAEEGLDTPVKKRSRTK